jgi:outer membrane protein assembly factor BamB
MTQNFAGRAAARKPLRWWPVALIAVLIGGLVVWTWTAEGPIRQMRVLQTISILFLGVVLLVLWLLLLSRLPWRVRLAGFAAVVALGFLLGALFRIRGVSGDFVPILEWRWAASDAERMAAAPEAAAAPVATATGSDHLDYPQFQGPSRDATLTGVRLDPDWSANPPELLWRQPIGAGWSAFAVVGDIAVTQEQRGDQEMVVAYDLETGQTLWTHGDTTRYETTIAGVGPRATPTVAENTVYALGATGLLNALDLATGRQLWQRDVLADNEASSPEWGKSCSPLVVDDLVVVSAGGPDGKSLAAYHRDSGEPVWGAGDDRSGYASPLVTELAGVRQILIFNRASVAGHDPDSGRLLWQHPWPADQPNVSQPLPLPDDRLLVSSGYGIGSKLFHISRLEDGQLSADLTWESPRLKAKFANLVFHEGYVYGLDDGVLVCLDPATGERCWKRGRYGHGQVILLGDLLLVQSERGELVLVEADPAEHRELARFRVLDGKTWNPPTFSAPYLLVRNDLEAACYRLRLKS